VFVKVLDGEPGDVLARWRRATAFERLVGGPGSVAELHSPLCLGWHEPTFTMVFEDLTGATSDAGLTVEHAREAGRVIGALHSIEPAQARFAGVDRTAPQRPELDLLEALTVTAYLAASAAQLEVWALLQRDPPVVGALRRLRAQERDAPRRLVHGDLRPDQFLVHRHRLYLTDWEYFRIADPARDIGNMIGSWLYQAARAGGDKSAFDRARHLVRAFWQGYLSRPTDIDTDLVARATAFAGWHQYDMSTALAARRSQLPTTALVATGIGRRLLLEPGRFGAVTGPGDRPRTPAWT
jgi:aminoglycoside phosphotransferase (APT) family kinase protein